MRRFLPLAFTWTTSLVFGCGGDEASPGAATSGGGSTTVASSSTGSEAASITGLSPDTVEGGLPSQVTVLGQHFNGSAVVVVAGQDVPTTFQSDGALVADLPPLARGEVSVAVRLAVEQTAPVPLTVTNAKPTIAGATDVSIPEEVAWEAPLTIDDFDGDALRVTWEGLPPGATWDTTTHKLYFRPDFIQGGDSYPVTVTASDGTSSASASFVIAIADSIAPPWPVVTNSNPQGGYTLLTLSQTTDGFLDSPGFAGRTFEARVSIPDAATAASPMPVRVYLHGFDGTPYTGGSPDQFRVYAHDPNNTYWWGYADTLPGPTPTSGSVPNYTERRVLHLLEWVLRHYDGADANRTYVAGDSMGGAGAATLGLLYARHFMYVDARIGQMVPRNHRPSRIAQLTTWWGAPDAGLDDGQGMNVWDRMDLTRALRDEPEARSQMIFTKHGKDDPTIHFGTVTIASPLTQWSYYGLVEHDGLGHYAVWDEGGHGSADPVLAPGWWDNGFSPVFDATSFLRRDLPFPAFSHASFNDDPGDGTGKGTIPWSPESGYAANEAIAGDTGWTGDLAGALSRFLRWDATGISDTPSELRMPLFLASGTGGDPPGPGYPTLGDKLPGPAPETVDVTIRRARAFVCTPGELVHFVKGAQSGDIEAGPDGAVTVPGLSVGTTPEVLILTR